MLKKLLGKKKETQKSSIPTLSPALTQAITNFLGPRGLPSMPKAAQKAFELSVNPNADAPDFVEVIQSDEALSARILKIANSVYFDRGRKSETIEESVFIIGLTEVRSLLTATTLSELFPSNHPARKQLWEHSIATAVAAKSLAQRVKPDKVDNAFLAGLIHDIGKLLMLQKSPDTYEKVLEQVRSTGMSFVDAETEHFVFSHCEVGHFLARRWNFSDDLISVIRCHHDKLSQVELLGRAEINLTKIVRFANILVHANQISRIPFNEKFCDKYKELLPSIQKALRIEESALNEIVSISKTSLEKEADLFFN